MQKGVKDFIFSPQCMCIQRFDIVLFWFIFIVLASNYSLHPPRFYGNKGIIVNQWTAKYGACPINPEVQVLFIPIVPSNTKMSPEDKSFQNWPWHERVTAGLCPMELLFLLCCTQERKEMPRGYGSEKDEGTGRDAVTQGGMKAQGGMLVPREGCWYPGRDAGIQEGCRYPGGMKGQEGMLVPDLPSPVPLPPQDTLLPPGGELGARGVHHGSILRRVIPTPSLILGLSAVEGQGVTTQHGGTVRASLWALAAKAQ